jgi:integrase/recombinase XerC
MTLVVTRPKGTPEALVKAEPADELLATFPSGRSDCTRRAYNQDLDDFRRFLGTNIVSEAAHLLLSRGHGNANSLALAWRANLQERRLQATTINRRLAALRSLVQLARTLGIVPWTLEVRNVRAESYRDTRGPGRRGVRLLLDEIEGRRDKKSLRDRAALRLLYDLGLRRSELVTLDVDDLDLDACTVSVLGKGRTTAITAACKLAQAKGMGLEEVLDFSRHRDV